MTSKTIKNALCDGRHRTGATKRSASWALLFWLFSVPLLPGQNATTTPISAPANAISLYVNPTVIPTPARRFTAALGNRVTKPGNERVVLSGTFQNDQGSGAAKVTWQAPGNIRFDGPNSISAVYNATQGLINATALPQSTANILESLLDDAEESLIYGFVQGAAMRYLGGGYRPANAPAVNYQGPRYELYVRMAPVKAQVGQPVTGKTFFVDTRTGLLAKTQYTVQRSGTTVSVVTAFNNWINNAGQAFPGQISRIENGTVVFTFNVTTASSIAAANDGIFVGQ